MNRGTRSRGSVISIYGLLVLGIASISVATLPGVAVFRKTSIFDIVAGAPLFDVSMLAVSGGLLVVGLGAVALGLLLAAARSW